MLQILGLIIGLWLIYHGVNWVINPAFPGSVTYGWALIISTVFLLGPGMIYGAQKLGKLLLALLIIGGLAALSGEAGFLNWLTR